jgi:hypothetical protein
LIPENKKMSITLSQFFGINKQQARQAEIILKSEKLKDIKQTIEEENPKNKLPDSFYDNLFEVVLTKLNELLNLDIFQDILLPAWSKHPELQEYRDPEKHPPDEIALVPLLEHAITSSHKPTIEPTIAGRSLGEIAFEVEVEAIVKGAILEIRDAKIVKVKLGGIDASGSLGFSGVSFLEKDLASLEFPGSIDLPEGFAIASPSEPEISTSSSV